jgi:hypothetical protein
MNLPSAESEVNNIRTGRPKAENPKNLNVTVRFDADTYQRLDNYCKENQQSKADVVRISVKGFLEDRNGKEEQCGGKGTHGGSV